MFSHLVIQSSVTDRSCGGAGLGLLGALGFDRSKVALHLQRRWPDLSDWDEAVGGHHHPNTHLSAVLYLPGSGSGEGACFVFMPPSSRMSWCPVLRPATAVRSRLSILSTSPTGTLHPSRVRWCCSPLAWATACWSMAIRSLSAARSVLTLP